MSLERARIFILVLLLSLGATAHSQTSDEARVGKIRAALVYYITKFVQAPPSANGTSFEVCIVGKDHLAPFLASTFEGKTVSSKSASIREIDSAAPSADTLKSCSVVILGASLNAEGRKMVFETLKTFKSSPLTICAVSEVEWGDCMIEIFERNNKARVAIDVELLEAAGYRASSELLEVSVVKPK